MTMFDPMCPLVKAPWLDLPGVGHLHRVRHRGCTRTGTLDNGASCAGRILSY